MTSKRRALLATLLATTATAPANAGCLDWLFGTPAATPYAAGYAPQATITPLGPPTLVGPAYASPGVTAPMTAPGFAPYAAAYTPYAAGYAGLQPTVAAQAPAYGAGVPAYNAGVPAYGLAVPSAATATAYAIPYDNPSVLTGRPVVQASATSYMGNPYATPAILPPAAYGPPIKQTSGLGGFFGRLFGNNYETSYYGVPTTSYRPVTQVDPATGALVTVQQPCTSLTQQVQRSPYVSLQPTAQPAMPYYAEPVCGGEPPRYAPPPPYANPSPYPPVGNYAQPSGVSQATALAPYGSPNGATYASPIPSAVPGNPSPYGPSTYPGPSAYPAPLNTQPLTGNPGAGYPGSSYPGTGYPGTGYPGESYPGTSYPGATSNGSLAPRTGAPRTGDSAPVPQPQLDANRPTWSSPPYHGTTPSYPPSTPATPPPATTGGMLEAPQLPTVTAPAWPDRREAKFDNNLTNSPTLPAGSARDRYSDIPPIPAADDYRAPAWGDLYLKPSTTPVDGGRERKPAPAQAGSLGEPRTAQIENENNGQDESWRYASTPTISTAPLLPRPPASLVQPRVVAPRVETPRSDAGWFVVEPR